MSVFVLIATVFLAAPTIFLIHESISLYKTELFSLHLPGYVLTSLLFTTALVNVTSLFFSMRNYCHVIHVAQAKLLSFGVRRFATSYHRSDAAPPPMVTLYFSFSFLVYFFSSIRATYVTYGLGREKFTRHTEALVTSRSIT